MRLILFIACTLTGLLLAACSNSPANRSNSTSASGAYNDNERTINPIPPAARARRQADAYPNSQGVSGEVLAANRRREQAFNPRPSPEDGYYAAPRARAQVKNELAAENQTRATAFGNVGRGQPRPIDLGPGPGLTLINPNSAYASQAQVYGQGGYAANPQPTDPLGYHSFQTLPANAPPPPANARPGQCFVLIEHAPQYRTVTERIQTEPESTYWLSDCAPASQAANSTGQTACLLRDPARFQTARRQVAVSNGGYEWRETPCQAKSNNAKVLNLQRALKQAGYSPGPIDGIFGQQTQAAAYAYQRDHGLAKEAGLSAGLLRELSVSSR